jgi:hypothetical protein
MDQLQNYALALELLGAKVEVTGRIVTARRGRARVDFLINVEDGLFGWGNSQDGTVVTAYNFQHLRSTLGLDDQVKASTIITRALKTLGMSNRGIRKDFYVHGEYSFDGERIRTIVDFYDQKPERVAIEHWDELKGALDMAGHSFELHDCGGAFHYIAN